MLLRRSQGRLNPNPTPIPVCFPSAERKNLSRGASGNPCLAAGRPTASLIESRLSRPPRVKCATTESTLATFLNISTITTAEHTILNI